MIIIGAILAALAVIYLSVGATAIIISFDQLKLSLGIFGKPWIVIICGISAFLMIFQAFILIIENKINKEKQKYEIVTEPLYRKL